MSTGLRDNESETAAPPLRNAGQPMHGLRGATPDPETELLRGLGRTQLDGERLERARALIRSGIDWERLLHLARWHCVSSLLYGHLEGIGPEFVRPAVVDRLRAHFAENTRLNLFRAAELVNILGLAHARGLNFIAYKGPALALLAYGHLGLREFADLDILVRPADIAGLCEILEARGYEPKYRLDASRGAAFRRFESVLVFHRRVSDSTIELHWRLMPRYVAFPRDPTRVWDDLAVIALGGHELPSLTPETTLLFLAVHGAKHYWNSLGWVCDVACLLERAEKLDWARILGRANDERCVRMLFVALLLAHDLLGATVSAAVLDRARRDRTAVRLAAQVGHHLLRTPERAVGPLERTLFLLRCRERLRDRVRCGFMLALSPNEGDLRLVRLPPLLVPLYPLVRLIRLTCGLIGGKSGR